MENERKMQNDENKIEENRDWNTKGLLQDLKKTQGGIKVIFKTK